MWKLPLQLRYTILAFELDRSNTTLLSLFSSLWGTQCLWFSKTIWNADSLNRGTFFLFASVHLRWSQRRWQCFWMLLIFGFSFASPCSNILHRIMLVLMPCRPRDRRAQAFNLVFSSLSLMCRDFCRFTESFDDIMGCRWWNPQIEWNEKHSKTIGILAYEVFQKVVNLSPSLLMKDSAFQGFIKCLINLFTCRMIQSEISDLNLNFPRLWPCPAFWKTSACHQFGICIKLNKTNEIIVLFGCHWNWMQRD